MKRLARVALFVAIAVIALGAIVLLCVNLYVQSQGTQARIQQELSQRLGTPIKIQSLSVTPWGGLSLHGITIPQISPVVTTDFLEARGFHLYVKFWSLFSGRLVIKKVTLISPTVVWPQNEDGKWRLPGVPEEHHREQVVEEPAPGPSASLPATATAPSPEETLSPAPSAPIAAATPTEAKPEKKPAAFVPEVRGVTVTDGDFRFLDRLGNMVADFQSVDFQSSVRNGMALRGTARIAKVSLRDRFFLENLHSPLHYDPKELNLSNISARGGGGEFTGNFSIEPQTQDSPFRASVKFHGVQADQLISEAGGPTGVVQGLLEGSIAASGKTGDPNALKGEGEIVLHDGQVKQYSLLVALGQVLQIEELTQLHLEQAEAKYHIGPGLVTIDQLVLRSPNIRLSATGTVTFGGKLRLDSQLAINDKIRSQLFKPIRENFRPLEDGVYSAVDFQVNGTVDRPKSNLVDRIVGRDLKDFVSGLLGGGKKSDKPKKKKGENMAVSPESAASPSVTPAPDDQRREGTPSPTPSSP